MCRYGKGTPAQAERERERERERDRGSDDRITCENYATAARHILAAPLPFGLIAFRLKPHKWVDGWSKMISEAQAVAGNDNFVPSRLPPDFLYRFDTLGMEEESDPAPPASWIPLHF